MLKELKMWWKKYKAHQDYIVLCSKYGICSVHGELMVLHGSYALQWDCKLCIQENEAKNIHREQVNHLERVRAQEQIKKALITKVEFQ